MIRFQESRLVKNTIKVKKTMDNCLCRITNLNLGKFCHPLHQFIPCELLLKVRPIQSFFEWQEQPLSRLKSLCTQKRNTTTNNRVISHKKMAQIFTHTSKFTNIHSTYKDVFLSLPLLCLTLQICVYAFSVLCGDIFSPPSSISC